MKKLFNSSFRRFVRPCMPAALAVVALIGLGLSCPVAQASYIVTVAQVGTNVVATGSGSINFNALTSNGNYSDSAVIQADFAAVVLGPTALTDDTYYSGITGPATFGTGSAVFPGSGSGDIVGLATFGLTSGGVVAVPLGYASGASLGTSTDTWDGATFSSLGLTAGTSVWTWGSGANADSFTLDIGAPAPAPEPSSFLLLGIVLLAGLWLARKQIFAHTRSERSAA